MNIFDFDIDTGANADDYRSLSNLLGKPSEAEQEAQRKRADEFIRALFFGDVEFGSEDELLRSIVERAAWFLPVKEDGNFEILNVRRGEYERAIWGVAKDGRRTDRTGKGGQFISAYSHERPGVPTCRLTGRALARRLPDGIAGILICDEEGERACEVGSEFFPKLRGLIDSVDIEEALLCNGPVDSLMLRRFTWLVDKYNGHLRHNQAIAEGDVAGVFTHRDRELDTTDQPAVEISGDEIFRLVADDPTLDGVVINAASAFGSADVSVQNMVLSPGFLHRLFHEKRSYLRVQKPIARSIDEVNLWLEINDFPKERRIVEEQDSQGRTTLTAVSLNVSEHWRYQETVGLQDERLAVSPTFTLQPESLDAGGGFGESASLILCPGLLARELYVAPGKKGAKAEYKPGMKLLVGRLLTDEQLEESRQRQIIAEELLKLVPRGEESIPRHAILTVRGADFLRRLPETGTREWIAVTLQQCKRNTAKWVWG